MIKKKVLALDDRDESKASKHIIFATNSGHDTIKDKDELK